MKRMRAVWMLAALSLGVLTVSCGGGGDALIISELVAIFTADPASVGSRISLEAGDSSGDVFEVEIHASDIDDLYGVAFTLLYDPAESTYLDICEAQGSILLSNPGTTNGCDNTLVDGEARFEAKLENGVPGVLNVLATKEGQVGGVDADPPNTLVLTLTFQADGAIPAPGVPYGYEGGPSSEVQTCPQDTQLPCSIATVAWDGGRLVATGI
jgi:hypothetical protein